MKLNLPGRREIDATGDNEIRINNRTMGGMPRITVLYRLVSHLEILPE